MFISHILYFLDSTSLPVLYPGKNILIILINLDFFSFLSLNKITSLKKILFPNNKN